MVLLNGVRIIEFSFEQFSNDGNLIVDRRIHENLWTDLIFVATAWYENSYRPLEKQTEVKTITRLRVHTFTRHCVPNTFRAFYTSASSEHSSKQRCLPIYLSITLSRRSIWPKQRLCTEDGQKFVRRQHDENRPHRTHKFLLPIRTTNCSNFQFGDYSFRKRRCQFTKKRNSKITTDHVALDCNKCSKSWNKYQVVPITKQSINYSYKIDRVITFVKDITFPNSDRYASPSEVSKQRVTIYSNSYSSNK